ncbi:MAG: cysteine desulfurase CsdA [Candidatus Cloacimonadota bacterium]|nr:MAG: cysteine desulfurase CsdA [Candidatus Cloacimonadota bacterium]PIE81384.1 MAG: cysteine desulfurase CsdA [Candidatus Delongbacteria bacterium]
MNHDIIRREFSLLNGLKENDPIIYLDNAATSPKPDRVIDRISRFYRSENATVHRGVYDLSYRATENVNRIRRRFKDFINAESKEQIIFTKGTTEGFNLLAYSLSRSFIKEGDNIVLTQMEHHANILPWQTISKEKNIEIRVIPITKNGELDLHKYATLIDERTALVSVIHISNVIGCVNPIEKISAIAKKHNAIMVLDAAQSISHIPIDVQKMNIDFMLFSGHKMYGPTGIGVLYGKKEFLEAMPPYQTGGSMIEFVSFRDSTFAPIPEKFEAGTPPIAEIIGLGEALQFIKDIGFDIIGKIEDDLLEYTLEKIRELGFVKIVGDPEKRASLVSFTIDGVHPHDIGTIMDQERVCIRVGHHCAQPLMEVLEVPATARISISFANTYYDIDRFVCGLHKVKEIMM